MKTSALHYFHAQGKVCLTIHARRIFRKEGQSCWTATMVNPENNIPTMMCTVGMAFVAKKDAGTRKRGRAIAQGRSESCLLHVASIIDKLPYSIVDMADSAAMPATIFAETGQFWMHVRVFEELVAKLHEIDNRKKHALTWLKRWIQSAESRNPLDDDKDWHAITKELLLPVTQHNNTGKLYKIYRKVFETGEI